MTNPMTLRRSALLTTALVLSFGLAQAQSGSTVTPDSAVEADVGGPGAAAGNAPVVPASPLSAAEAQQVMEHIADARQHIGSQRLFDALRDIERAQTALLNSRYARQSSRPSGGPVYADLEAALGAVDSRQRQEALAALDRASTAIERLTVVGSAR